MNGAAYWDERERAKKAALKMAANLSARDKGLVVTATRRGLANAVAHDKTQRRCFERGFLSLDHPDEDGNMWDYGDCGREMRKMLRSLDADYREHVRSLRFAAALDALDGYPALQDTLRAICRFRRRKRIAAALGIPPETYAKRFTRICRILAPPARIGIPDGVRAADKIFFSPENKGRNGDLGFFHVHAEGEILT